MKTYPGNLPGANRPLNIATANAADSLHSVSLQLIVNQFLGKCMTEAFRTKSVIVNHISRDIKVPRDKAIVAPVIRELLNIMARNARNGDIVITAEKFRDIIILKIQDRNNYNGYAVVSSLYSLEPDALMVNGNITVEGAQQKVITVSFSFPGAAENISYDS